MITQLISNDREITSSSLKDSSPDFLIAQESAPNPSEDHCRDYVDAYRLALAALVAKNGGSILEWTTLENTAASSPEEKAEILAEFTILIGAAKFLNNHCKDDNNMPPGLSNALDNNIESFEGIKGRIENGSSNSWEELGDAAVSIFELLGKVLTMPHPLDPVRDPAAPIFGPLFGRDPAFN